MQKSEERLKNILAFVEKNPGFSSTQIAERIGITVPTAWKYLSDLVKAEKIELQGNRKSARYFPQKGEQEVLTSEIFQSALEIVSDSFDTVGEMLTSDEIMSELSDRFAYIHPDGRLSYGFSGFVAWCHDPKRGYTDIGRQLGLYLCQYLDEEHKRRKNGFFDAIASLQANLAGLMSIGIDRVLFAELSEVSGFGRTRTALELYYGKQNSSRILLLHAIEPIVQRIREYVIKSRINTVIFTPPTIPRPHQFRDVLRESLSVNLIEIPVSKISPSDGTLQAQKNLKGIDRIVNATATISVTPDIGLLPHLWDILILDDNFTTGATMNAIALKLRDAGYRGKITAITMTGKFFYDPNVVDSTEI